MNDNALQAASAGGLIGFAVVAADDTILSRHAIADRAVTKAPAF